MLAAEPDPRFAVHFVWIKVLFTDSGGAAARAAGRFADPRITHYWDGERALGRAFAPVLGLPRGNLAWDVYLLYGADERWRAPPPEPAFWMHQLGNARGPRLDRAWLATEVRALLARTRAAR